MVRLPDNGHFQKNVCQLFLDQPSHQTKSSSLPSLSSSEVNKSINHIGGNNTTKTNDLLNAAILWIDKKLPTNFPKKR